MPNRKDDNRSGEKLVALFVLGIVLFNPLVVGMFDAGADTRMFGIPALYLYLFAAWALLIGLVAVVAERAPEATVAPPGPMPPIAPTDDG
jgi:hypothetical protein